MTLSPSTSQERALWGLKDSKEHMSIWADLVKSGNLDIEKYHLAQALAAAKTAVINIESMYSFHYQEIV